MLTRVRKSAFARNVAVLMTGTALAQALTIAASPILTRLYDPEAFGILGLFTATSAIISVVAGWKYELAIVLPKEDEDAVQVLLLACTIVLGMTVFSVVLVWLGGDLLAQALGSPELARYLWWLPVSILMTGLYNAFNFWSTRRKHFKRLSISQGFRSVGMIGTQIPAGVAGLGAAGLVGGSVAGASAAALILGGQIWREERDEIMEASRRRRFREVAKEHIDFPKYSAPQGLINALSQNVPAFLLAFFFDPAAVGLYWFTHRLLKAPSILIGRSVRQVYFQRASQVYNEAGNVFNILRKSTLGLAVVGLFPALIILAAGPTLFEFVFGEEWYRAGIYAQWIIVWWYFGFLNSPSVMTIPIYSLQGHFLVYEIALGTARVVAITVGALIGNDVTAIALFTSVSAVFNLVLILGVMQYVRRRS